MGSFLAFSIPYLTGSSNQSGELASFWYCLKVIQVYLYMELIFFAILQEDAGAL